MKTFDEWSNQGYRILKGSKATFVDGVAKFSLDQVWKPAGPTQHQKKTYRYINRGDHAVKETLNYYKPKQSYNNTLQGCIGDWDHWDGRTLLTRDIDQNPYGGEATFEEYY